MSALYLVRRYRPDYFTGFDEQVISGVEYDKITEAPWCENFKRNGFVSFYLEPYTEHELIFGAKYQDGTSWVAGFATNENSPMARDWRYGKSTNTIDSTTISTSR